MIENTKCFLLKGLNNNNNNNSGSNGNGISSSLTDKESITPSPPNRIHDDVKSEPMELVCGSNNNIPSDEHSNDSVGEHDGKYSGDGKGSLRYTDHFFMRVFNFIEILFFSFFSSNNEDDIDNSIHSHTAPPFLMSPAESKLFSTPGSFNFSMAALAADSAALAG